MPCRSLAFVAFRHANPYGGFLLCVASLLSCLVGHRSDPYRTLIRSISDTVPDQTGHPSDPIGKLSDISPDDCPTSIGTLSALNRNAVRLQIGLVSGLRRNTQKVQLWQYPGRWTHVPSLVVTVGSGEDRDEHEVLWKSVAFLKEQVGISRIPRDGIISPLLGRNTTLVSEPTCQPSQRAAANSTRASQLQLWVPSLRVTDLWWLVHPINYAQNIPNAAFTDSFRFCFRCRRTF